MPALTPPAGRPFVDLSSLQAPAHVDWRQIASTGVGDVYLRAAEGTTPDAAFETHGAGARAAGLRVGWYQLWRPRHSPYELLQVVRDVVGDEPFELPPVIDLEMDDPLDVLVPEQLEWHVATGLTEILVRTGVTPMLYVGPGFVAAHLPADHRLGQWPLWWADYRERPVLPRGWSSARARQWTGEGRVAGYPGNADCSVWIDP